MVNFVPLPGSLCTAMVPLWASTIFLSVGSPRPEPPERREKEWFKDLLLDFRGHANAGINQAEQQVGRLRGAGFHSRLDGQRAALRHGLCGIEHQVEEPLFEWLGIEINGREIAREEGFDFDMGLPGGWAIEVDQVVHDVADPGRGFAQLTLLDEAEKIVGKLCQPLCFVLQPENALMGTAFPGCFRVVEVFLQQGDSDPAC